MITSWDNVGQSWDNHLMLNIFIFNLLRFKKSDCPKSQNIE
jgi:hypothetical protein